MKKELRPIHDVVSCDVCGRTILKGERAEWYLAPGGQRHKVCDLCAVRAQAHGWIRESAAGDMPTRTPRHEPRRGLGRLRRRRQADPPAQTRAPEHEEAALAGQEAMYGSAEGVEPGEPEEPVPTSRQRPRSRPKDPRHVRAVPTTHEGKVDRAFELFNGSGDARTIAGLARTLGPAWVNAQPDPSQPSAVSLLVAWELSWYRYRVDLGAEDDPVVLLEKGEELEQLDESMRDWNARLDSDGRMVAGVSEGGLDSPTGV